MLCSLLKHRGYEAIPARNGSEALEKARCALPNLIISDILMPQTDGFRLCLEVKQDEKLRAIPFVFYAAPYADQEDEKLAVTLGASLFIYKPINTDKLVDIISEVINENKKQKNHEPRMPSAADTYILKACDEFLVVKPGKRNTATEEMQEDLLNTRKKLLALQKRYRNIFNCMSDVIITADLRGNIVDANEPALETTFGYVPEDIKGVRTKVLYAAPEGFAPSSGEKVLGDRELVEREIMKVDFRKKTGQVFKGELYPLKFVDEKGELIGNISVMRGLNKS